MLTLSYIARLKSPSERIRREDQRNYTFSIDNTLLYVGKQTEPPTRVLLTVFKVNEERKKSLFSQRHKLSVQQRTFFVFQHY